MSVANLNDSTLASVVGGPVFAAEWDDKRRQLTVHSCSRRARNPGTGLSQVLPDTGERIDVRIHRRSALLSPRSLEALSQIMRAGTIVYDPTEVFSRAILLVTAVKAVREEFAGEIAGYYFDASSRAILALARQTLPAPRVVALQERMTVELQKGLRSSEQTNSALLPVRVVTSLPRFANCTPIDKASVRSLHHWRTVVKAAAASLVSSGLLIGTAANAKTPDHSLLGSLSVFAESDFNGVANGFVTTGIAFFFGDDGVQSRVEVQLAQGAAGDSGPGLRIIVDLEKQVENGPEIRRPASMGTAAGAGPGS
jgi:hypothetical protein